MTIEVVESRWGGKTLSAGIQADSEVTEEVRAMLDKLEFSYIDPRRVGLMTDSPVRLHNRQTGTGFEVGYNASRMFYGLMVLLNTMSERVINLNYDDASWKTLKMFRIKLYDTRSDDDGIGGFNHREMFEIEGWIPAEDPLYSKYQGCNQLSKGGQKLGSILVVMHQDTVHDSYSERTEVFDYFNMTDLVHLINDYFKPYDFYNVERIWYHQS